MKTERPIIYKTDMVRAYLEGNKTQTRRVIKPQPDKQEYCNLKGLMVPIEKMHKYCPYGQVGSSLWVRETWRPYSEKEVRIEYKADGKIIDYPNQPQFSFYACGQNWHPSIHMPRWASRINQTITGIRVEKLQDITEEDAIADGGLFPNSSWGDMYHWSKTDCGYETARTAFHVLWDSISGKKYPWESNPLVWVISYPRYEG